MRSPRRSCATELRAAARCDASSSARATKASHFARAARSRPAEAQPRGSSYAQPPARPAAAAAARAPRPHSRSKPPCRCPRARGRARAPSRAPAFGVLGRPLCDVGLAVAPLVLLVQPVVVGNLPFIAIKVSEAVAAAPPTEERLFEGSVTTSSRRIVLRPPTRNIRIATQFTSLTRTATPI